MSKIILSFDPRKCLNKLESSLGETMASSAEFSVTKMDEAKVEKPLVMTEREKAIYWMGINQGLVMCQTMLGTAKEFAKLFDEPVGEEKKTESGIIL